MMDFSDWINRHSLIDLHLGGARYTWSNHQIPPSLSRIGRLLVSGEWLDLYLAVCQSSLPKLTSDHCLILLNTNYKS